MATIQIEIDENLNKQATKLFSQLGIDMSEAINIFLKQCVMAGDLPFEITDYYKQEVLDAIKETKKINNNPNTKKYSNFSEAQRDLEKQ